MKKILILLSFLFGCFIVKAQTYPVPPQSLGSLNINVRDTGGLSVRQTLTIPYYVDTSVANTVGYPKNYKASLIIVGDSMWLRDTTISKWINLSRGTVATTPNLQQVTTVGKTTTLGVILGNITGSPDLLAIGATNLPSMSFKQTLSNQVYKFRIGDGSSSPVHSSFNLFDSTGNDLIYRVSGDQFIVGNYPFIEPAPFGSKMLLYGGNSGANLDSRGDATTDQSTFECENHTYDSLMEESIRIQEFGDLSTASGYTMGYPKIQLGELAWKGDLYDLIVSEDSADIHIGTNNKELIDLSADHIIKLGVNINGFSGALDTTGVSTFGINGTYIYDGGNGGLLGTDAANGKAWIGDRDDNLNYTNIQLDDQAKTIDVKADNGTTFAFTADAVGQDSLVKVQGGINITRGVRFSGLPNSDTSAYLTTNNSGTLILKHIYSGGGGGSINIGNTDLLLTSNRILGGSDTKNFTLDSINHFVVNTHNGIDFEANYDNSSGSDDIQFNNNRHGNGFLLGSAGDAQLFSVNHNAVILHSADGLNISIDTALKVNGDPGSSGQFLKSQGAVLPPVWATISGSGTVTSFSSGNLSPLFTTTVATSTTTPAQTFALSNTTNYTLFGRASGTGVPSFLTSIDSNWIPTLHSKAYYDGIYQPLENQRLSTTNSVAFQAVNFLPQASAILPPASGNTLFDSAGINYRGSNGITIRLPKSLLTANRADSFPDESGIFLLRKDSTIFTTPFYVSQHSGGTPSLTSQYVGYGSGSNILTGSNTLITDGSHLTIGATSLQTAPIYATATSGPIAMFSRNGGFGFASGADVLDAATDGTSMQSEITAQGDGGVSRFWVGAGNTGKKITQLTTFSSTTAGTFAQLPFNLALSSVLCSNDYNGDFEIGSDPLIIMGRPIILGDNIYPTAYGMKRDTFGILINRQQSLNVAIRGGAQLDVVGKSYSDSIGQSKFTNGIATFNSVGTLVVSALMFKADTLKAQSGAVSSISTITPSTTGLFNIGGMINITAITLDVIQVQCTYKDETGASVTVNMGTSLSTTGYANISPMTIWAQSGTAITIKTILTTGTGSIAYDIGAYIEQKK